MSPNFPVPVPPLLARAFARGRRNESLLHAYRAATENSRDGFYVMAPVRDSEGRIVDFTVVDCNEPGARFHGIKRADLLGRRLTHLEREAGGDGLFAAYRRAMECGWHEEDQRMPSGQRPGIAWGRRRMVRVGDALAVTLHDISERKAHENQLERLLHEDSLTGLPNRQWLLNHIPQEVACRAAGDGFALLFIDLDDFKQVNDAHGHAAGDRLLQAAARRLQALLRPDDRIARFGGDEFIVLLRKASDRQQFANVAARVVAAFRTPFALGDGIQAVAGASVGISVYPQDGDDAPTLIRHADLAMYAAKNEGKGRHRFFDQALAGTVARRTRLKQHLLAAVEQDQFALHYQPRVDPLTGTMLSMEALLRWQHPEWGTVSPAEFIPLAESNGMIHAIGDLVIDKACAQLASWRADGLRLVPMSINVSARQFERGVVRKLGSALAHYDIPAALLEVEITESAMLGDQDGIIAELAALRALGVRLHVDDFGTGYSSLSQLQRLRMDVLKVDRAFTAELDRSREGRVFFEAIVSMARALGMGVVAEGVETEAQMQVLRELNCNEVQGYFVSRPLHADAMSARFLEPDSQRQAARA